MTFIIPSKNKQPCRIKLTQTIEKYMETKNTTIKPISKIIMLEQIKTLSEKKTLKHCVHNLYFNNGKT